MEETKFASNEQFDNLTNEIELSVDILKNIHSNYNKIVKLLETIDSEKKLEEVKKNN